MLYLLVVLRLLVVVIGCSLGFIGREHRAFGVVGARLCSVFVTPTTSRQADVAVSIRENALVDAQLTDWASKVYPLNYTEFQGLPIKTRTTKYKAPL